MVICVLRKFCAWFVFVCVLTVCIITRFLEVCIYCLLLISQTLNDILLPVSLGRSLQSLVYSCENQIHLSEPEHGKFPTSDRLGTFVF